MTFQASDSTRLTLFVVFCGVMLGLIVHAMTRARAETKHYVYLVLYLGGFSLLVESGLVRTYMLPLGPLLFLSVLAVSLLAAFSPLGTRVTAAFSLTALVGLQSFRYPLELLLHRWAKMGVVPTTMTWNGQNWDIVSGIVSFLAIPFVRRYRKVAWAAQIIGVVLLLNVLRVVVMSSPLPFAWPLENPLQLISYFPYALIGPLFVGVAVAGHALTFRKLLEKPQ